MLPHRAGAEATHRFMTSAGFLGSSSMAVVSRSRALCVSPVRMSTTATDAISALFAYHPLHPKPFSYDGVNGEELGNPMMRTCSAFWVVS